MAGASRTVLRVVFGQSARVVVVYCLVNSPTNAGALPCQAAGVIQRHWVEAESTADGDEDAATSDQVPQPTVPNVIVIHRTTGVNL